MHPNASITPAEAVRLVQEAGAMTPAQIASLQLERLREIVSHAREHSPYLREKYAALPERPNLADIPPMTRAEAAPQFDQWVADPDVTGEKAREYLSDIKNASEPFLGKYSVLTTSGTTGVPLVVVRDARHSAVNAALMGVRLMGGGKLGGIPRLREPDLKIAGIIAGGGYHSTYLSYLRIKAAYEQRGMGERQIMIPFNTPIAEKVRILNAFQPEVLSGYPSSVGALAMMQKAGDLNIRPLAVACSAEHLSPATLKLIEETFGAPVVDNYCSTEGGEVAFLCKENRMHVNSDWMIIEPVDADMKPVRPGEPSDGILMTNLANLVQPLIRYYVSDRVVLSDQPCPCGQPFPHMAIEGRKEDVLVFAGKRGRPVPVEPIVLVIMTMDTDGCLSAQYVQRSPDELEIRWESVRPDDRRRVGDALLETTRRNLSTYGAGNVTVSLSDEPPIAGKSGKVRTVVKDFRDDA